LGSFKYPEILKKAIPGCEEFTKNSDTEFTAKATNKIGPFNASFTGDVELKDLNPLTVIKLLDQEILQLDLHQARLL
jgi:carbon monoxide dehydrogenase subunit G